ncbi:MFS transporter [Actinoplanes sp. NEAU-A12]|uniref:MFS transporter n=1 Tax=Actinoplanes sandaracinus TaxID=3045177 RepID=A0ABT6WX46_9ACTN|nr:MFS transporter [Actinoplanes sandaracinus]MDI6104311.1 MFS transporter [Actinoplanes sandaracinus]
MSLVDSVGTGVFVATVPLFLIRHQHLSAYQVGWMLSAAGLALLLTTVPAGHLADLLPLRALYVAGSLVQAVASVMLAVAPSTAAVWVALIAASFGAGIVAPPRSVIVARVAAPDNLVRVRAYNRSVFSVGMSVGAGIASLVVLADRPGWYGAGFALNAITFVVNSVLVRLLRIRVPEPQQAATSNSGPARHTGDRWAVYRDVRFLLAAAVNALLFMTAVLVDPLLAVYVATGANTLTVLIPALIALNTVLTVVLQVPLSRRCVGAEGVRATLRRAGVAVLVGCVFVALSAASDSNAGVIGALILGMTALTCAEIFMSAASWETSFLLAPPHLQGQYFSTFNLGPGLAMAFGPGLLAPLVLLDHGVGWLLAGSVLCAVGIFGASVTGNTIAQRVVLAAPAPTPSTTN